MKRDIIVAGGDMRFAAAADLIAEKGAAVRFLLPAGRTMAKEFTDIEKIGSAEELILPVPVSKDGKCLNTAFSEAQIPLERLPSLVKENGRVYGGKVTDKIRKLFAEKNASVTDYMEDERLTLVNAFLTAEGAVMYSLEHQDIALFGQKVLIVGMGRIGKALIQVLRGFSADITASARKDSDMAYAEILGAKSVPTSDIPLYADKFTLIFNTVPSLVIGEDFLKKARKDALIIDLASAPGGTDFKAAERYGISAVSLLGVPGKFSYITAGELIARTVLDCSLKGGIGSE